MFCPEISQRSKILDCMEFAWKYGGGILYPTQATSELEKLPLFEWILFIASFINKFLTTQFSFRVPICIVASLSSFWGFF